MKGIMMVTLLIPAIEQRVARYLFKTAQIWMKGGLTPEEMDEEMRQRAGMTPEEWRREKAKIESKQESMRTSNRAKRYRRWMKQVFSFTLLFVLTSFWMNSSLFFPQHTPVSGFGDG